MALPKLKQQPTGGQHHLFAVSLGEWRVAEDIEELIKQFRKSNLPFAIWYVPGPSSSAYEIKYFKPVVEGAVLIGHWG